MYTVGRDWIPVMPVVFRVAVGFFTGAFLVCIVWIVKSPGKSRRAKVSDGASITVFWLALAAVLVLLPALMSPSLSLDALHMWVSWVSVATMSIGVILGATVAVMGYRHAHE